MSTKELTKLEKELAKINTTRDVILNKVKVIKFKEFDKDTKIKAFIRSISSSKSFRLNWSGLGIEQYLVLDSSLVPVAYKGILVDYLRLKGLAYDGNTNSVFKTATVGFILVNKHVYNIETNEMIIEGSSYGHDEERLALALDMYRRRIGVDHDLYAQHNPETKELELTYL
jgi:hypothetical protein